MHLAPVFLLAQIAATPLGIEVRLDEVDGRSRVFVDLARTAEWSAPRADDAGWPASDARATFFNLRAATVPPDYSGTYRLSFTGQAAVSGAQVENLAYDETANTTTADVVVAPGAVDLALNFTATRRTPDAETDTGIANVRLIRPGYAPGSTAVFTSDFLRALAPFAVLSYKYLLSDSNIDRQPLYPDTAEWDGRRLAADATQQPSGGRTKNAPAWEYLVLLANLTGKDIWINIPVSASDGYVAELARLLRRTLRPELKVYVELSQSLYNGPGAGYQYAAAAVNAAPDDPQLNEPPAGDREEMIRRWHARRLVQAGRLFEQVYGEAAMNATVRMVLRWWRERGAPPIDNDDILQWVERHFGPPGRLFYGISAYHMFYESTRPGSDASAIVESFRAAADNGFQNSLRPVLENVAAPRGLKLLVFSGGPNLMAPSPRQAEAFRSEAMGEAIEHVLRDKWFASGGDVYAFWGLAGGYERVLDDVRSLDTPYYGAIRRVAPAGTGPSIDADGVGISPNGVAVIRGQNFTTREVVWDAVKPGWIETQPNALDGVIVRAGGRDCAVLRVSPGQVEVQLPPDLAPGDHELEMYTNQGETRTTVTVP